MRKVEVICNSCNREIKGQIHKLYDGIVSRETGDVLDFNEDGVFSKDLDFCENCINKFNFLLKQSIWDLGDSDKSEEKENNQKKFRKYVDDAKIWKLHNSGKTPKQIAEQLGCSFQTVYNHLHKRKHQE